MSLQSQQRFENAHNSNSLYCAHNDNRASNNVLFQTHHKGRKSHFQKHLRKPQSFNNYLCRHNRSDSISISSDSTSTATSSTESEHLRHNNLSDSGSMNGTTELLKRVSSVMRFTEIIEAWIDDGSSISSSDNNSEDEWDPLEEEEEQFLFVSSSGLRNKMS
ncbi:6397_t:CDS:1 [Ambispora gerdemannii]|uniref:6397_t:CDS:1 n=1 Tax=Ambispora gerdemannii TaxID=144530 RepID=A0A9N9FNJ0_9GLOM|nr:6397_t:CDS:1 [Ambispora gerdemannii]